VTKDGRQVEDGKAFWALVRKGSRRSDKGFKGRRWMLTREWREVNQRMH
jgi:hypothetical protein